MKQLTDAQIARLFVICDEIAAVKKELPAAPQTPYRDWVNLEIAKNLRISLEQHSAALRELADLLAPLATKSA